MIANKKLQKEAKQSKRSQDALIANLPGMLYKCRNDEQLTMEYVNQGCEPLTGYSAEELLNNGVIAYKDIIHPDDRNRVRDTVQKAIQEKQHYQMTYRITTRDKGVKWVWEKGVVYFSEEFQDLRLEGFISDISEQKRNEWKMEVISSFGSTTQKAASHEEMGSFLFEEFKRIFNLTAQALGYIDEERHIIRIYKSDGEWRGVQGKIISLHQPGQTDLSLLNEISIFQGKTRRDVNDVLNFGDQIAIACLPLVIRKRTIGFIWLGRDAIFEDYEIGVLQPITQMATGAIDRIILLERTQKQLKRIESLHIIDQAISGIYNLELISRIILEQTRQELGADAADILLLNPVSNRLDYAAKIGFKSITREYNHVPIGTSKAGEVIFSHKPVQLIDLQKEGVTLIERGLQTEEFQSYFAVPVTSGGQVKGVLEIFRCDVFYPDNEWMSFMEALGTQAAIAIDTYHAFEDLQSEKSEIASAYESTIESWSKGLELRDFESAGHSERVVDQTIKLAKLFGIKDEKLTHIQRGAVLHDIGKIGITDEILLKKGELSDEDWEAIKTHPLNAYRLLSPIKILKQSLDIPYCHHEHWDGSGYPRGLKGKDIPLAARIFAVVDTWDALQTSRPYRPPWRKQDVINYLREQAGKQFDPEVVDKFLNLVEK